MILSLSCHVTTGKESRSFWSQKAVVRKNGHKIRKNSSTASENCRLNYMFLILFILSTMTHHKAALECKMYCSTPKFCTFRTTIEVVVIKVTNLP